MRRRRSRRWGLRDRLVGGGLVLAAGALMVFGVQGVMRDLERMPPTQFVEAASAVIGAGRGQTARDAQARAIRLFEAMSKDSPRPEDFRRWTGVHLSAARQAFQEREFDAARDHFRKAENLATASLRGNPLHPLTWTYLAQARMARGDDDALSDGYRFLTVSYAVAPVEPDYFVYRLQVALAAPQLWDADLLKALRRDLSSVLAGEPWRPAVRAFVARADQDPRVPRVAAILIGDDPELRAHWNRIEGRPEP